MRYIYRETKNWQELYPDIVQDVVSTIYHCECGEVNHFMIVELKKLRQWEVLEIVGTFLDVDWVDIKRISTFMKKNDISEEELMSYYVLGFNEGGSDIAYHLKDDIILILQDRRG